MKLHQKGFLLLELSRRDEAWDYELVQRTLQEYGLAGRIHVNNVRAALDEMAAAGLLESTGHRLDDGTHVGEGKVLFRYRITQFGRERLEDAGLNA